MGNIATNSSGNEGMAIINNNYDGQYYAQKVYLEHQRKDGTLKGKTAAEWVPYSKVESQYPMPGVAESWILLTFLTGIGHHHQHQIQTRRYIKQSRDIP